MTEPALPPVPETLCIGQARLTAGLDRMDRIDLTAYHSIFGKLPRLTADELIDWSKERLAKYKVPKSVVFTDSLPRTGAGKVLKSALRERHAGS